jgi:hypothetical protein
MKEACCFDLSALKGKFDHAAKCIDSCQLCFRQDKQFMRVREDDLTQTRLDRHVLRPRCGQSVDCGSRWAGKFQPSPCRAVVRDERHPVYVSARSNQCKRSFDDIWR